MFKPPAMATTKENKIRMRKQTWRAAVSAAAVCVAAAVLPSWAATNITEGVALDSDAAWRVQGQVTIASDVNTADIDVTRYGAKPDGMTDNTAAIQKAIDECAAKGGGRVLVPGGGKYVTYTLNLKDNVELHIDRGATLLGGEDPFKYPLFEENDVWNAERAPRFNRRAMFYTVGQRNVAITGAGTIDGNAEKFHHEEKRNNWTGYKWFRNSHTNITGRCVFFVGCSDVRLDDVLILHPSGWSTWFLDCDRVGVRGVRIEADRRFPNGDGLHFGGCRDVTVSDCIVHSQDDAFIVRTHQEQMKKPRPCERMVVNNCIFNSYGAFAIRVGWRGDGPVKDVSFDNIISTHSRWGVGFTVPSAPKGIDNDPPRGNGIEAPPPETLLPFSAENVRFSNMSIECSRSMQLLALGETTPVAYIKDISFSHCRFKSPCAPVVKCRPQDGVQDWRFSDVVFEIGEGAKKTAQEVFKGIKNAEFDNVKIVYAPEQVFWNMEVEVEGEKAPLVVESVEQKCRMEGDKLVCGPLTCGGRTFDMKVVVNVRDTPSGKAYSGVVENNDKRVRVTMFNGPKLDAVALDPAKAHIYIPAGFGRRLNYFPTDQKKLEPWERKSNEIMYLETSPYPSRHLSMPWIAIDTGSGTWYAAVHDAQERFKRIGVRWYNRAKRTDVRFRHPVSIRAGDKWELPETVFEKMSGDWHDAAKRYRAWFDSAYPAVGSAAPDWTCDVNVLKASRATSRANAEPFPELFRYTFPELVTTTRNPTPMTLRSFVNYAAVFGLRHEIEIRYMPDRTYVLNDKVPAKKDYGEVKNLPSLAAMHAEPPDVASAYMKSAADFQREHAKYLLRGTFVDEEGFAIGRAAYPQAAVRRVEDAAPYHVVAKRFVAADGTSAVCVWNISDKPADVTISGLGKPIGVFAPRGEAVDGQIRPDSLRLYVYGMK